MDAIVQLIRNALCCIKDLDYFPSTILHDASHTAKYYTFPSPHLNQTTPLELLISLTQLYACVSCTISGYKLATSKGILKLRRLTRIAALMNGKYKDIKSKKAASFIRSSIMKEASSALNNTLVGVCVLSIGISFFWLFGNSLHVTAAGWIGGLPALIHALTVMEIALLPLLYLMLKDAASGISKAATIQAFVEKYSDGKNKPSKGDESWIDYETFSLLEGDDWTPLWSLDAKSTSVEIAAEEKVLTKEVEEIESKVEALIQGNKTIVSTETAERLQDLAVTSKFEGYREYVYFLLNFIAFYGYLLGIIVYYFDQEEEQPSFVTTMKMGATNDIADWTGNFAGDLMWTIEPAIILSSPFILKNMVKRGETKIKSD